MSDLELPCLNLPSLKMLQCTESDCGSGSGTIVRIADGEFPPDVEDGCQTPTSEERRIPVPTSCPPAPRKTISRKRRRTNEVAGGELLKAAAVRVSLVEIEEFFHRIQHVSDQERIRVIAKGDGFRKKSVLSSTPTNMNANVISTSISSSSGLRDIKDFDLIQ